MTASSKSDEARRVAQLRFEQGTQRKKDGAKALTEYEAARVQERAKTAKLRALRLAKEEADQKAKEDRKVSPKLAGTAKRKVKEASS